METINDLKEEFMTHGGVEIEFVHGLMEEFLTELARMFIRRIIEDAEEERRKQIRDFDRKHEVVSSGNGKGEEKALSLPVFPIFKYSRPCLHEAIIIDGLPFFIYYDPQSRSIITTDKIEESNRILRPPNRTEYPYIPYEFVNAEELQQCLEKARSENIDTLYNKSKIVVKRFNDQDDHKINLIAIDIVWSYFQDCFPTTHYIGITGDNDSGKSSIGNTFELIGYRAVNMTSPSVANVFRMLGMIESGQCTLVLDEADSVGEDTDMMNILKSGYNFNKKVPKTNTNSWKVEWFHTYCLKIIIGEKSPSKLKAKGLLDRAFLFSVFAGDPDFDIKEMENPKDPRLQEVLSRLLDFRKLMFVYRLVHFNDNIPDLDVGVIRRNKELVKPYIRLFYGSKSQEEVEQTFQTFLDIKNEKKSVNIESILIPSLISFVESYGASLIPSKEVWSFLKSNFDPDNEHEYDRISISDHLIYKNTITRILEDKFGAKQRHCEKGNAVMFDIDKLRKIQKSYDVSTKIRVRPIAEGTEGTEGSRENAPLFEDYISGKNVEISQSNGENNIDISQNKGSKVPKDPLASSLMPSEPSEPSGLSEEPLLLRCYYCAKNGNGKAFETYNETEYLRHGTLRHHNKPMYPNSATIEKYNLIPQGQSWENKK